MPAQHDATRAPKVQRAASLTVYRATLLLGACAAAAVTVVVGMAAWSWVGKSFPGFFVLPNRIVASIGREAWEATREGFIYQRTVVAVADEAVETSADAYRAVAVRPSGAPFALTLRDGVSVQTLTVRSRTFSESDYWIVFGSYLATGLLYLWIGMLGAWLRPDTALGRALLLLGGTGGIYALTGAGIYQPDAGLRIHALAEACFPATFVYLALVLSGSTRPWVPAIGAIAWWLSLGLAVVYQIVLGQPGPYTLVHNACEAYLGVAGLALGVTVIVERARAAAGAGPLLRAIVVGALLGIGVPAVVMTLSGLSGGALPVNYVTATAFLLPLCIGYGLLRERYASAAGVLRTESAAG